MQKKSVQQKILERTLRFMARSLLYRHKPTVVGITGSVGKTLARDAIFHVLSKNLRVRQTQKNYNNEIGLSLTVIGAHAAGRSLIGWMRVCITWLGAIILPSSCYPDVLVLEFGIDHPGDMDYLLSITTVDIAVVSAVSDVPVHIAFFDDVKHLAREKEKLATHVSKNGMVILNYDDRHVRAMKQHIDADTIFFGCDDGAMLMASDITLGYNGGIFEGLAFKINYDGKIIPVRLKHVLARHHIYAILASVAVGSTLKLNFVDIAERVASFVPPRGRMNRLEGKNDSIIIDDSYNASPVAMRAALETLCEVPAQRRVAVLGDMLELGEQSQAAHRDVATEILKKEIDYFFAVGIHMEEAYHFMREKGYCADRLFYFEDPILAGQKIAQIIASGDVILVKGSQSMRMEKITEQILKEPQRAEELLPRQDKAWKAKEFVLPQE